MFSYPTPLEAVYEIRMQLAYLLLRRCLKLAYDDSPESKVKE